MPIKLFNLKLADEVATLKFKKALKEKERKHLRSSGKIAKKRKTERKWRVYEHRWKLCEKLKLGD